MELNFLKLVLVVACCGLCKEYTWIVSRVELFDYSVINGRESGESLVSEGSKWEIVSNLGEMKPSGCHDMLTYQICV